VQPALWVGPGRVFGLVPARAHFRTTILPPTDRIRMVVEKLASFHASFGATRGSSA